MGLKTEALTGGFVEPVFHAQSVFKMLMDGMARPGTIQTVQRDRAGGDAERGRRSDVGLN
ncbi:phosphonate C-P lyase system protein PhnH, partial [Rhizobium johnstonii]